jgi:hypothetical protein
MSIRNDDAHELARVEAERQSRLVSTERLGVHYLDSCTGETVPADVLYERLRERVRTLATQLENAHMHTAAQWTRALLDEPTT